MRKILIHSVCALLILLALALGTFEGLSKQKTRRDELASEKASRERDMERIEQLSIQLENLNNYKQVVSSQASVIDYLKKLLSEALGREYSGQLVNTMSVTATAYTARKEECDSHPWVTASGTPSRVGAIAISRDLESQGIKLGDMVIIKGMGTFRVEDRMNKRWKNRIDILHANVEAAKNFAKRNVELMWLDKSEVAAL